MWWVDGWIMLHKWFRSLGIRGSTKKHQQQWTHIVAQLHIVTPAEHLWREALSLCLYTSLGRCHTGRNKVSTHMVIASVPYKLTLFWALSEELTHIWSDVGSRNLLKVPISALAAQSRQLKQGPWAELRKRCHQNQNRAVEPHAQLPITTSGHLKRNVLRKASHFFQLFPEDIKLIPFLITQMCNLQVTPIISWHFLTHPGVRHHSQSSHFSHLWSHDRMPMLYALDISI